MGGEQICHDRPSFSSSRKRGLIIAIRVLNALPYFVLTRVMREYKAGEGVPDKLMAGSSLEGKAFVRNYKTELQGFLLQVNLQHKILIFKVLYILQVLY